MTAVIDNDMGDIGFVVHMGSKTEMGGFFIVSGALPLLRSS